MMLGSSHPHSIARFRWVPLIVCLTIVGVAFSTQACATTAFPLGLDDLTTHATYIFAGTVADIAVVPKPSAGLISRISFTDLRFVKGSYPDTRLVMTIRGGTLNSTTIRIEGLPEFHRGSRYIVFADSYLGSGDDLYLPIVGLYAGLFQIKNERGSDVVQDWAGRSLVRVDWPTMSVMHPSPPRQSRASRDTLIRFEQPTDRDPRFKPGGHVIRVETSSPDESSGNLMGQERDMQGREVVRVVDADPGTRIREPEFLAILRRQR
jgi:hypothetical protein